jgi:hypothetical protein
MANAPLNQPMILDTDLVSWRNLTAVKAAGYLTGIRVFKVVLAVGPGGTSSAGTVTITAPSDSATLYPPIPVAATVAIDSILTTDEPTEPMGTLTWRDFAVTGLTATGTRLFLWWTV